VQAAAEAEKEEEDVGKDEVEREEE